MQKRKLGRTDMEFTVIGFGAWAIGGPDWPFGWGPQDDNDSIAAIREALALGINWIDTAAVYGLGHSEEIVRRALQGVQNRPFIATKCGLVWDEKKRVSSRLKRESVIREAEASLRRLGVDVIDLYQIHWPMPGSDIEEGFESVARLVEQGKVRWAGVSNFDVSQMQKVSRINPIASLQPPYNMIERSIENEILPYCAKNSLGVVAYSPMQNGLLTGRMDRTRIEALPKNDWRRKSDAFREPLLTSHLELVEKLRPISDRLGMTLAQLAIAWVLRRPEVTSAIVGARNPKQIQETAKASEILVSADTLQEIDELLDQVK